jgi:hypothetical protein
MGSPEQPLGKARRDAIAGVAARIDVANVDKPAVGTRSGHPSIARRGHLGLTKVAVKVGIVPIVGIVAIIAIIAIETVAIISWAAGQRQVVAATRGVAQAPPPLSLTGRLVLLLTVPPLMEGTIPGMTGGKPAADTAGAARSSPPVARTVAASRARAKSMTECFPGLT